MNTSAQTQYKTIISREWGLDQNGNAAEIDVLTETFNVSDIEYLISSDSNDAQKHAAH